MGRFFAIAVLGCMTIAQFSLAQQNSEIKPAIQPSASVKSESSISPELPPLPRGHSTVIGGAIRDVDPVRDRLTLKVFGGQTMKILFDERTRVYRDGARIPLRDLKPDGHASVETILDGTDVFASSIHLLSKLPEGECDGQVLAYNSGTGELTVSAALSHESIELHVPSGTPIVPVGQAATSSTGSATSSLIKGTLISVTFQSGKKGRGIARHISIIAVPGSQFVFSGNVTFLDLHSRQLALIDPRDGKNYKISFDSTSNPVSQKLREGSHVVVNATFDGTRYLANAITVH
jgi:hypothetical protein